MLSVIILKVIYEPYMLIAVMLSVIMLNVMAPIYEPVS